MIKPPPVRICFASPFQLLARLQVIFGLSLLSFSHSSTAAPIDNATEVERLIKLGTYGRPPILWFSQSPEINVGSGSKTWTAVSGGRIEARSLDPWGRLNGAFGPTVNASGGAAVSGSTTFNIISPRQGSVIFFCPPGAATKPPMLLFSLADWGDENYFSLRVNGKTASAADWNFTLAVADAGNKNRASQFEFASVAPLEWSFVAITWSEQSGIRVLNYWAGSLSSGELVEGRQDLQPMSDRPGTLIIPGRRSEDKGARPGLAFAGGLLSQFAIYDSALSEDTVKRIYLAAIRR
jgi:hypothetical protein